MELSKKKAIVFTGWLSCILNRNLSQKVKNYLRINDYELTSDAKEADIIVFSGCAVTEPIELYNLKELIYLEKIVEELDRGQKIVLIGCLKKINDNTLGTHFDTQNNKRELLLGGKYTNDPASQYVFVDTYDYSVFDKMIDAKVKFDTISEPHEIESVSGIESFQLSHRAFKDVSLDIKIKYQKSGLLQAQMQSNLQKLGFFYPIVSDNLAVYGYKNINIGIGCKNRCAYCAIKFAKSKIKSIPMDRIVEQIRTLQKSGEHKFILLCDDMRSWGLDIKQHWMDLLKAIENIRTPETKIALFNVKVEDLLEEKATIDQFVDSGLISYIGVMGQHINKEILLLMKRKPFEEDEFIDAINEYGSKGVHMHSYNIIGFPGETDEHFNQLLSSLKKIKTENCSILNFPYSNRVGTLAASYPDHISKEVINQRLEMINNEYISISLERFKGLPDDTRKVLTDLITYTAKAEEMVESFNEYLCEMI